MLKKPVFFAVFAALIITNLSATLAQTGFQTHSSSSGVGWQTNQYAQFAPAATSTSNVQTVEIAVVNYPETTLSQTSAYAATQVSPNVVPVANAYAPVAPAPSIPLQPVVRHAPATTHAPVVMNAPVVEHVPAATYAPAVLYTPAVPMQPVCTSGG